MVDELQDKMPSPSAQNRVKEPARSSLRGSSPALAHFGKPKEWYHFGDKTRKMASYVALFVLLSGSATASAQTQIQPVAAPRTAISQQTMPDKPMAAQWYSGKGTSLHADQDVIDDPVAACQLQPYRLPALSEQQIKTLVAEVKQAGGFMTARDVFRRAYGKQGAAGQLTETILPGQGVTPDQPYDLSKDTEERLLWLLARYKQTYRTATAILHAADYHGVDRDFMIGLAGIESSYRPDARAHVGTASGLYQFISNTWLSMVKKHGHKYGLEEEQKLIKCDEDGRCAMEDEQKERALLDKRFQPELSALMAAEFALDNAVILKEQGGLKTPSATDLYMAHFFGAQDAARFFKARSKNAKSKGASLFPAPARHNRTVFYRNGHLSQPRNLDEIHAFFAAKMDVFISRYHRNAQPVTPPKPERKPIL